MSRYDEDRDDDRIAAALEYADQRERASERRFLPVAVTPPQLPFHDHEFVPDRCALCGEQHADEWLDALIVGRTPGVST